MKAVLMSINPQWCEKIFNGEKTVEVRKTAPKIEPPFKVYVYQTKNKGKSIVSEALSTVYGGGKVIGEFVCDRVNEIKPCFEYYADGYDIDDDYLSETCLTQGQLREYGKGKTLYGWHITEPKLYDKPKELGTFIKICPMKNPNCAKCEWYSEYSNTCTNYVTRPPQGWMYVEELC